MKKLLNYNKYLIKWFKEDEEFLTQKFSIINDIQKFQCADFELNELESIKSIPINLNWNPISIKNNNKIMKIMKIITN